MSGSGAGGIQPGEASDKASMGEIHAGDTTLRSQCYARFAHAFAYPDAQALEAIRSGETLRELATLVAVSTYADDSRARATPGIDAGDAELQAEFTRLFEAGENGPACPPHESAYRGGRMQTLESLLRFYEFFGLGMGEELRQEPDHLRAELEFMHFLSFQEEQLRRNGESPLPLQLAQRDFLGRHLASWIPLWLARMERSDPATYFLALARMLAAFIAREGERFTRTVR